MSDRDEGLQAAFERGCLVMGKDPSETTLEELIHGLSDAKQRAQRHLDRNERLQANFFEHAPGGLVMVGSDMRIHVLNSGVRAVLPVVPNPIGRQLSGGVPFKPLVEVIRLAMERGERQTRECVAGRFDLLIRAEALEDGGAIAVIADVSSIQQAARARSDFVSNVSHELRTPVTSILGYSETLLARPEGLDADTLLMLEAIDRNANRLTRIFDELLDLARIEARLQEMALDEVDLRPMILDLARTWAETADLRRISLIVELPDHPLVARVHIQAFDRILGNLVANAIKYSPSKAKVGIRARISGSRVVVEVEDQGPGIDPTHHSRIFERFYRVDKGRSRDVGGTGLGLALVKHLCLATGAKVGVRSNPGHGATFSVRFPT